MTPTNGSRIVIVGKKTIENSEKVYYFLPKIHWKDMSPRLSQLDADAFQYRCRNRDWAPLKAKEEVEHSSNPKAFDGVSGTIVCSYVIVYSATSFRFKLVNKANQYARRDGLERAIVVNNANKRAQSEQHILLHIFVFFILLLHF